MLETFAVAVVGVLVAYFLAGFPTGVVIGKRFYGIDIREHGSHNTGMTNTIRTLGLVPGIIVFAIDLAKGALGVAVMKALAAAFCPGLDSNAYDVLMLLAGLAAIAGHVKSPYLHFKGGKGAATALGVVAVAMPLPSLIVAIVWLAITIPTRIVSIATMAAAVSLLVSVPLLMPGHPVFVAFSALIVVIIFWAHRENIVRIMNHTEGKLTIGHAGRKGQGGAGRYGSNERGRRGGEVRGDGARSGDDAKRKG